MYTHARTHAHGRTGRGACTGGAHRTCAAICHGVAFFVLNFACTAARSAASAARCAFCIQGFPFGATGRASRAACPAIFAKTDPRFWPGGRSSRSSGSSSGSSADPAPFFRFFFFFFFLRCLS